MNSILNRHKIQKQIPNSFRSEHIIKELTIDIFQMLKTNFLEFEIYNYHKEVQIRIPFKTTSGKVNSYNNEV